MNVKQFVYLLTQLPAAHWQQVIEGRALLMQDDESLIVGDCEAANVIILPADTTDTPAHLQQQSLATADAILNNYYLSHPLTLKGFNTQVQTLFSQHALSCFAGIAGEIAEMTLFVDGGEVIAENTDSPRHRYGAFCEVDDTPVAAIEARVQRWLDSGDAYDCYRGMNVCRYSC